MTQPPCRSRGVPHKRKQRQGAGDPRQDDFDIWLGTRNIAPWIASARHSRVANYLYLDGHAVSLDWSAAAADIYPDKVVLVEDGSYPE